MTAGGYTITVAGTYFTSKTTATIDGVALTSVKAAKDGASFTATVPKWAGTIGSPLDIIATNEGGDGGCHGRPVHLQQRLNHRDAADRAGHRVLSVRLQVAAPGPRRPPRRPARRGSCSPPASRPRGRPGAPARRSSRPTGAAPRSSWSRTPNCCAPPRTCTGPSPPAAATPFTVDQRLPGRLHRLAGSRLHQRRQAGQLRGHHVPDRGLQRLDLHVQRLLTG